MIDFKIQIIRGQGDNKQISGDLYLFNELGAKIFDCDTLERSWKDNENKVSCIPAMEYDCEKVQATEHIKYDHISILNVPGREGVCIHILNYFFQSQGCIGVGFMGDDINKDGEKDLLRSKDTFNKLMALLPQNFKLIIS